MNIRCPGGWTDPEHAPLLIGEKEPYADARTSDGVCDACSRAMGVAIVCRWCGKVESAVGLCDRCDLQLSTHVGEPIARLTVFRQGGLLAGNYDGSGVALRLRAARREPDYRGFQLQALAAVPR